MIKSKSLWLIIIFLTIKSFILLGQYNLTIEITDLRNNNGKIVLDFYNEQEETVMSANQVIIDNKCIIVLNNIKPGIYGFKYFHDENENSELDTNLIGIPKEGYGFSNNAKGRFGPPDLEKTLFEVKNTKHIKCKPGYLF